MCAAIDCFRRDWQEYAAGERLLREARVTGAKVVFNSDAAWNEVIHNDTSFP